MREIATNTYLTGVVQLIQDPMHQNRGVVDCYNSMVAVLMAHIESLTLDQKRAVIPHLRRLGYSVLMYRDDSADDRPMSIYFPGKAKTPKFRLTRRVRLNTYYYATSPGMLRLRGVLWCLPRLLAWKWRAVEKANAPDKPGGKRWRAEYALYVGRGLPVPNSTRRRIECSLYQERQWPITMWLG